MPTGPRLLDMTTLSEVIKGRDPQVLRSQSSRDTLKTALGDKEARDVPP